MPRRIALWILTLVIGLGTGHLIGCSNSLVPPKPASLDPETELTYAPVENDTTSVHVQLYWNGFDRDGEVVKFYFAVDADTALPVTEWKSTTAKDSTFLFPVDPVAASRIHVFMVSAVDNDGRYDRTPARRVFSSGTKPPTSLITKGPAPYNPLVPPTFTFEWSGTDPDGSARGGPAPVDSFEYLLLRVGGAASPGYTVLPPFDPSIYTNLINAGVGRTLPAPHDDWKWIGIRGKGKRFSNVPPGEYVFVERAVDEAGAIEKGLKFVTNIRHFSVVSGSLRVGLGPGLTIVCSSLTRPIYASGPIDVPRDAIQVLEGETISFSWSASSDSYGGVVVGYAYALDDTAHLPNPNPLATGTTLTPGHLYSGGHTLFIKVIDDLGLVTNAAIPILVIHPTFKDPGTAREILYVDDSLSPGNTPARVGSFPSDVEETNWWTLTLLPNLRVPFTEWDTYLAGQGDVEGRMPPSLNDLSKYSTVIWNVDFNNGYLPTGLHKTLFEDTQSSLAAYLRGGGTLILSGFAIGSNVSKPLTILYGNVTNGICAGLGPGEAYNLTYFSRNFMGVDGARANADGLRTMGARDFVGAIPTAVGVASGYDSALVDRGPLGSGAKWITYPGSGDPNTNASPGLPQVDGLIMAQNFGCQPNAPAVFKPENPSQPIAQPVLLYHGANVGINEEGKPSPREGTVVGVQVQAHGLGRVATPVFDPNRSVGRMVHLSLPLYFLRDQDAVRILRAAYSFVSASPTLP